MSETTTESTVYAIYIATTAANVWEALTASAFTSRYFFVVATWMPPTSMVPSSRL